MLTILTRSMQLLTAYTAQKMQFSIKVFFSKLWSVNLVTFTEKILNGKLFVVVYDYQWLLTIFNYFHINIFKYNYIFVLVNPVFVHQVFNSHISLIYYKDYGCREDFRKIFFFRNFDTFINKSCEVIKLIKQAVLRYYRSSQRRCSVKKVCS